MRLKTLFRDGTFFSKQNPNFWKRDLKLSEIKNINVQSDAIISHTNNFTSKSFKNPKLKYFMASGILTSTAIAYYFWSKPKSTNNIDTESLMKAVYSFQAGDIDAFVCELVRQAENNKELKTIIYCLESEDFYQADQLAKDLFINKLCEQEIYYFVKGVILAAYAELHSESVFSDISNKNKSKISLWYHDAVDCFIKVTQSNKNKGLQLLALAHYNRLINHLMNRFPGDDLSKLNIINYGMSITEKIWIFLQKYPFLLQKWLIDKTTNNTPTLKFVNVDLIYNKLIPLIKQYWRFTDENHLDLNRRITVRIWDRINISEDVGHVSLETPKHYISHWRDTELGERSLLKDLEIYGRLPDCRISFYTLDVDKINDTYINFKKNNCQWHWLASTILSFLSQKDSQNCSGLTLALLKVGGVEKYASLYSPTLNSLFSNIKRLAPSTLMSYLLIKASSNTKSETHTGKGSGAFSRINDELHAENQMKWIFIILGCMIITYGSIYFIYLLDDVARLTGLWAITHPEHIKMLVQNAQKVEINNMQPDSDFGTKKKV